MTEETRARVRRAAEELNYRPNLAARSMRTRRSGRVAVLMGIPVYNPVRLLAGAGAEARAAGYAMEVHGIDGDAETRAEVLLDLTGSGQYEGVVAFTPVTLEPDRFGGVPVVTTSSFDDEMHTAGELADATPVRVLVEGLAAMGHRRFLHVAGPSEFSSARAREDVYLGTVDQLGVESLGVVRGDWTGAAGYEAVRALPGGCLPLAVVAANDDVAVGVMRAAADRGWDVPGDLSVTGWDNYEVGAYLSPSLTTVDGDRYEAGRRAMQRLLAELVDRQPPPDGRSLNRVIWRESTAPPRPARPG